MSDTPAVRKKPKPEPAPTESIVPPRPVDEAEELIAIVKQRYRSRAVRRVTDREYVDPFDA